MQIDTILIIRDASSLHKSPDMQNVKHKPIKNTLPYHPVTHDDTRVPPKCRSGGKPTISRHPRWLVLNLKRVLSVERVQLRPEILEYWLNFTRRNERHVWAFTKRLYQLAYYSLLHIPICMETLGGGMEARVPC
jgi:hypothetical protein